MVKIALITFWVTSGKIGLLLFKHLGSLDSAITLHLSAWLFTVRSSKFKVVGVFLLQVNDDKLAAILLLYRFPILQTNPPNYIRFETSLSLIMES